MDVKVVLQKAEPKLTGVHTVLREKARQLIQLAHREGIFLLITAGLRTMTEQNALYEQGRTKPGNIVTNARGGYSYHNYGLAFDVCVCDVKNGQLVPNWNVDSRWKRVGAIGQSIDLEWGGNWTSFKDYPHFQYTFDLSLTQLRQGKKPTVTMEKKGKQCRLMTGTFSSKEKAEQAAQQLRKVYGWVVYVKDV